MRASRACCGQVCLNDSCKPGAKLSVARWTETSISMRSARFHLHCASPKGPTRLFINRESAADRALSIPSRLWHAVCFLQNAGERFYLASRQRSTFETSAVSRKQMRESCLLNHTIRLLSPAWLWPLLARSRDSVCLSKVICRPRLSRRWVCRGWQLQARWECSTLHVKDWRAVAGGTSPNLPINHRRILGP